MNNDLQFEGKNYISSKRAAQSCGYTQDYIGQLTRSKKIEARMVGRIWFVSEESLQNYKKLTDALAREKAGIQSEQLTEIMSATATPAAEAPVEAQALPQFQYSADDRSLLPELTKKAVVQDELEGTVESTPTQALASVPRLTSPFTFDLKNKLIAGMISVSVIAGAVFVGNISNVKATYQALNNSFSTLAEHGPQSNLAAVGEASLPEFFVSEPVSNKSGFFSSIVRGFYNAVASLFVSDSEVAAVPETASESVSETVTGAIVVSPTSEIPALLSGNTVSDSKALIQPTSTPIVSNYITNTTVVGMSARDVALAVDEVRLNLQSQLNVLDRASRISVRNVQNAQERDRTSKISFSTISQSTLKDSNLTNASITGSSISDSSVAATSLSANSANLISLLFGTASGTNAFIVNGTTTNSTSTNLFSDLLTVSGTISLQSATPLVTSNKLYANGTDLYWAGNVIGGASTGNWTTDGTHAWRATGNVGVGTSTPGGKLSVTSTGTQLLLGYDATHSVGISSNYRGDLSLNPTASSSVSTIYLDGEKFLQASRNNFKSLAIGFGSQPNMNSTEFGNTSFGDYSLGSMASNNYFNTAVGANSLLANTSNQNTALGYSAAIANTSGGANVVVGVKAMFRNETGSFNTIVGHEAGGLGASAGSSFSSNSIFGDSAGYSLSTGSQNILIGTSAATNLTTGYNNIIIGTGINAPLATSNSILNIGNLIYGTGLSGFGSTISATGTIGIASTTPWGQFSINPNGISGPSFVIGSSTRTDFVVTNGGNVGIGTAAPGVQLQIESGWPNFMLKNSSGKFVQFDVSPSSWGYAPDSFEMWNSISGSFQGLIMQYDSNATLRFNRDVTGGSTRIDGNNATQPALSLFQNGAGSILQAGNLNVANSGDVGIGTTSPRARLDLVGANNGTAPLFQVSSLTGFATTSRLLIDSSGNVGIKTTAPIASLDISPSTPITATYTAQSVLRAAGILDGSAGDGTARAGANLIFDTQGSASNLIIGQVLSLNAGYTGSGRTWGLSVANTVAGTNPFTAGTQSGNVGIFSQMTGAGVDNIGVYSQTSGGSGLNLGYYSRLTGSTGTKAVGYLANVNSGSSVNVGGYFALYGAGTSQIDTTSALVADSDTTSHSIFLGRVNGVTKYIIDGNGNVGIGTSTPFGNGLLTVGTSSPNFYVDRLSGNVGIGTVSPTRSLDSTGMIQGNGGLSSGSVVEKSWNVDFAGVANEKVDIFFPVSNRIVGSFDVTIGSGFYYIYSAGGYTKEFGVLGQNNGSLTLMKAQVTRDLGETSNFFSVGDFRWDATALRWRVTISKLSGGAQTISIHYKAYPGDAYQERMKNADITSIYTTDTTVFPSEGLSLNGRGNLILQPTSGNVGIGTTSPASLFTVVGGGACFSGSGATVACGNAAGNLYYRTANTGTYDVAENYVTSDLSVVAGDIVALDTTASSTITKAVLGSRVIGIVSTDPGLLLGGADGNNNGSSTRPVALSGRVPVKVNGENGNIVIGDKIALSGTPGVGRKAKGSEEVVGTALENWSGGVSDTGTVTVFVSTKQHFDDDKFSIDQNGNIGIGTTTPTYKLQVMGDIAATSFVNISTRDAKHDIAYLNTTEKASILNRIKTIGIAQYRYNTESDTAPLRLGLIAEEAPVEVLAIGGKGVDVYKLSTFILAGVQEMQASIEKMNLSVEDLKARMTTVESRLASLENFAETGGLAAVSASSTASTTLSTVSSYLASAGIAIDAVASKIMAIVTDTLTANFVVINKTLTVQTVHAESISSSELRVGTSTKSSEAGITIIDRATGQPYCMFVSNGLMQGQPGECSTQTVSTPTSSDAPVVSGGGEVSPTPNPESVPVVSEPVASSTPVTEPAPAPEPTPTPEVAPEVVPEVSGTPEVIPVSEPTPAPEPAPVSAPEPIPTP